MKRFLCLSILILSSINVCFSQWPQLFGTEYYWATPNHTRETYDKGFFLTLDFEPYLNTPDGSCIIKIDINGNELWRKRIGNSTKHLEIKGIAFDIENNIYISGSTAQFEDDRDPFIMKLNPCMEVEWCNIYQSLGLDDLSMEMEYIPTTNTFAVNILYTRVDNPISILNINTEGEKIWENFYFNNPNIGGSMPVGLLNSNIDSSLVLYGYTYAWSDSLQLYCRAPYWSKIDYNGNLLWEQFTLPDSAFLYSMAREQPMLINDSTMLAGVITHFENSQIFQINYNIGDIEWIKNLHRPDTIAYCVLNATEQFNGKVYSGVQYFVTGYNGIGCGSLQKNDLQGNFITETIMPANYTSVIEDICITSDSNLLISATHNLNQPDVMLIKYTEDLEYAEADTLARVYDSLCPPGITTGTIELACNIITGLLNKSTKENCTLTLAPNPAKDYTIIYLPETMNTSNSQGHFSVSTYRSDYVKDLTLNVINLSGQVVYSTLWPDNTKEYVLSTTNWTPGMYLLQIRNGNTSISSGKLLVK